MMRSSWSWPLAVVIVSSFALGSLWGWKLIRDRNEKEGRLDADSQIRVLAPTGLFGKELLAEFQRRERLMVTVATEDHPASLLRRALKSVPGQFDLVFVYHHQVSALRVERKLQNLYDDRNKFPTIIAPDFRRLPDDRNLMDTAPLLWGFIGLASKEKGKEDTEAGKATIVTWPSHLVGLESEGTSESQAGAPATFGARLLPRLQLGPMMSFRHPPVAPLIISHGQLEYEPLKAMGLHFSPIAGRYPLWILTGVAMADGNLERARRMIRYLIESENNVAFVKDTRGGASTLRESAALPETLRGTYLRTVPINSIVVENDERMRQTDDVIEQLVMGATLPSQAITDGEKVKPPPRKGKKAERKVEVPPEGADEVEPPPEAPPAAVSVPATGPSEESAHDD